MSRFRIAHQGFTIVELAVTVAILGVLAAMALPALGELLARQRVAAARGDLFATLMLARSQALDLDQRVAVCPTADGLTCRQDSRWEDGWLLFVDANFDRLRNSTEEVLQQGPLSPRVRISSNGGRKVVIFHPDGSASGFNATFNLCAENSFEPSLQLIVSNVGRLRSDQGPRCPV